ncbi:MAG: acetoacetate metabolism regulatory protein AtoC [Oligoflexia bacterium]|nr:MAG: acetoacetate metabolism regulatory protein AtoC [Oligoflexia bacterium]
MVEYTHRGSVIAVDDDPEMRSVIHDFLKKEGYQPIVFATGHEAIDFLKTGSDEANQIEAVISDIQMPGMNGIELTQQVKEIQPSLPCILITAFGSIESAIEAIRKGAFDYVTKPFKLTELTITLDRAVAYYRLHRENSILRSEIKKSFSKGSLIGKSKSMQQVFDLIERVSHVNANVLITGESGTGKEMVARTIHNMGPRANQPFIAVNCTAIPDTLLESELFGHAKGSFTGAIQRKKGLFEEAHGGTLFLDEIGDMDIGLQAKLLRVLQEKKIRAVGDNISKDIDVRIITATHKDLKAAIRENLFREDLYYRLAVIPIVIPPLRHRKEDIPILANHFLQKCCAQNKLNIKGFSQGAMNVLINMRWDGNVRELENMVERIAVMTNKPVIQETDIPVPEMASVEDFYGEATRDMPSIEQLEKRYIQVVLEKTGGKKDKAAHILGINRRTLYRKEREYGLIDPSLSDEHLDQVDKVKDE